LGTKTELFSENDRNVFIEAPRSEIYRFPPQKQTEVFQTPVEYHNNN